MHDGYASPTPIVGRQAEFERLGQSYARADAGEPAVQLVLGEAGVGKTTLLDNFAARIDAMVLVGGCVPVGGEAMPFVPVIAALRQFVAEAGEDQVRRCAERWPTVFTHLVPSHPERVTAPVDTLVPLSPSGQVRLFESILSMLGELAAERPLLWVVEDLQWADRSTLDLVAYLARSLRDERVLLVLTIRTEDLTWTSPLRARLADLERVAIVDRLDLDRLGRDDTARQLAQLMGDGRATVAPDLVDFVYDRSAGNPLFTEQLVPCAREHTSDLPATLRDLVRARTTRLPLPTSELLGVAAVVGREFELEVLATVAEASAAEVESVLRAAVDNQIVAPWRGTTYAFTHPLFREVLEADLLPGRRTQLHASTGRAIERLPDSGDPSLAGRIAYHWAQADAPDLALRSAIRAGRAAEEVYAFSAADEHYTRALRISAERPEVDDVDRVDLLVHASQSAHLIGDGERAVRLAGDAAALTADPMRRSAILERKGAYCFNAGLVDEADAAYRQALDLLPETPSAARARVYAGIGLLAIAWTRIDEAETACEEAIRIARKVDARAEEGRGLNALGAVRAYRGDFDTGVEYSRAAVEIAVEIGDPDDLAMAYIDCAHVLGVAGRDSDAVDVCVEGYAAMRRVGLARQDGSFILANAAESLTRSGRLDRAATLLDEALAQQSRGVRAFPVLEQATRLSLARGDLDMAQSRLEQCHGLLDEFGAPESWQRELYEIDAELLLLRHDADAAYSSALAGLDFVQDGDEQRFAGPLVMLAARALADRGQRTLTSRAARSQLDRLVDALRTRVEKLAPSPLEPASHPTVDALAVAATITAELDRCAPNGAPAGRWADAADEWERIGRPIQVAYCRWREAESTVLDKSAGSEQVAAVRRAYDAAYALDAEGLLGEIADLARWGRIDLVAASPHRAADDWADTGLTPRELEVLSGLVAGRTNREIADSLFISTKTASVHVSNLLHKLGVNSREQAARLAHARGMKPAE